MAIWDNIGVDEKRYNDLKAVYDKLAAEGYMPPYDALGGEEAALRRMHEQFSKPYGTNGLRVPNRAVEIYASESFTAPMIVGALQARDLDSASREKTKDIMMDLHDHERDEGGKIIPGTVGAAERAREKARAAEAAVNVPELQEEEFEIPDMEDNGPESQFDDVELDDDDNELDRDELDDDELNDITAQMDKEMRVAVAAVLEHNGLEASEERISAFIQLMEEDLELRLAEDVVPAPLSAYGVDPKELDQRTAALEVRACLDSDDDIVLDGPEARTEEVGGARADVPSYSRLSEEELADLDRLIGDDAAKGSPKAKEKPKADDKKKDDKKKPGLASQLWGAASWALGGMWSGATAIVQFGIDKTIGTEEYREDNTRLFQRGAWMANLVIKDDELTPSAEAVAVMKKRDAARVAEGLEPKYLILTNPEEKNPKKQKFEYTPDAAIAMKRLEKKQLTQFGDAYDTLIAHVDQEIYRVQVGRKPLFRNPPEGELSDLGYIDLALQDKRVRNALDDTLIRIGNVTINDNERRAYLALVIDELEVGSTIRDMRNAIIRMDNAERKRGNDGISDERIEAEIKKLGDLNDSRNIHSTVEPELEDEAPKPKPKAVPKKAPAPVRDDAVGDDVVISAARKVHANVEKLGIQDRITVKDLVDLAVNHHHINAAIEESRVVPTPKFVTIGEDDSIRVTPEGKAAVKAALEARYGAGNVNEHVDRAADQVARALGTALGKERLQNVPAENAGKTLDRFNFTDFEKKTGLKPIAGEARDEGRGPRGA